nr:uncharacterized protein LOC100182373 [Ciona intestinalis]|eukprot:XP_002131385.1 uncharacterized protein LOC100182373 [Ciona intestinalis]
MFYSKLLKAASAINRRNFSNEPALWKIANYRFFVPLQTRWRDTGHDGNLADSVYYDTMISLTQSFVSKFNNPGLTEHILTDNYYECRNRLSYPEVPLVGLGVTEVTGSRLKFTVGFFKQKSDQSSIATSPINLDLRGSLLDDNDVITIADHYDNEAAVLGFQATVMKGLDEGIPNALKEAIKLIQMNCSDLDKK